MTRAVRVGVADSGINPRDPQAGPVESGVGIRFRDERIERDGSWEDLLGHGTAVAATIRERAPTSVLYSIRVFHRVLEAHPEALLDAIEWATEESLDLLNLSLGFTSLEKKPAFASACARAERAGVVIVSADVVEGVIPVAADYSLEEDELRLEQGVFRAAPWARLRGELPRERNFHGTSFAVARVTGIAATLLESGKRANQVSSLREALARRASGT